MIASGTTTSRTCFCAGPTSWWWRFSFSRARRSAARLRARLSSSPERARVTVSLPAWRRSSRPRLGRAGSWRLGGWPGAAWWRGRSSSSTSAASGCEAARSASSTVRRAASAASSSARRGGFFLGLASVLGAALFFLGLLDLDAIVAAARFLERGHARFVGFAQQALLHLAAGGDVLAGRALRRRGSRLGGGRRLRRLGGRDRSLGRFGRGFARAAEDAALLDLDDDRVRAAVAEALLDLAGLDRALEAQRRPGTKLGLVGLVGHSIPSSSSSAEPGPGAASPPSSPASGSMKARHRSMRMATPAARGRISQGEMYHILAAQAPSTRWCVLGKNQAPGLARRRPARPGRASGGRPRRHRRRGSAGGPCRPGRRSRPGRRR